MPWSAEDADRHIKGLSAEQKRAWAKIANSALEQYGDEGRAIRVANSKVKRVQKRAQAIYVDAFAKALDAGFPDESAHRIAWGLVSKHGNHDQKTHGRRKKKSKKKPGRTTQRSMYTTPLTLAALGLHLAAMRSIAAIVASGSRTTTGPALRVVKADTSNDDRKATAEDIERLIEQIAEARGVSHEEAGRLFEAELRNQGLISKHGDHDQKTHGRKKSKKKGKGGDLGGGEGRAGFGQKGKPESLRETIRGRRSVKDMSDADIVSELIRRRTPDASVLSTVGAPRGERGPLSHTRPTRSTTEELARLARRRRGDVGAHDDRQLAAELLRRRRRVGRKKKGDRLKTAAGIAGVTAAAAYGGHRLGRATGGAMFGKSDAYVEFSKVDLDKRQVFGWAIVSKDADGNDVIDLQGDMVSPEDIEKAAYDYVINSRDGGEMHLRKGVSRMIESMVVTPDKLAQMGVVSKSAQVPVGWWVGFQIEDDAVWKRVKDGTYVGFSIHGAGKRRVVGKRSELLRKRAHEELGYAVMRGDDKAVEALAKHLVSS